MIRVFLNQNIISPYRLPLFEELDEDYDISVWFHRKNSENREWEAELEDYSFNYHVLNGKKIGPITLNPGFFFKLLREDFDLYFINENPSTFLQSLAILAVAKIRRKPLVIWSETIETKSSQRLPERFLRKIPVKSWRSFKESYRKILFRFSDRFVAFSEMAEEFLINRGVHREKINTQIQVMPEELLPEPEDHDLDRKYSDNKIILSLGYLEERKGVQDLIEAFQKIEDEDYRLVIAGKGPYEEELREKAEGDNRIEFAGYLSEQDKADYFDAADLFVLPTYHDPWGLVVNEALHYRTPVLTTEAAGAKELLGEENIFEPGCIEQIQEKIKNNQNNSRNSPSLEKGLKAFRETLEDIEGDQV